MAAIISGADFRDRRGLMNVALKRIELLEQSQEYSVDIFGISVDYRKLTLKGLLKGEFDKRIISLGGHTLTMLIKIEYFSDCRLLRKPLKLFHKLARYRNVDWGWHKRFAHVFKGYDAITAHFNDAAFVADSANRKYGIPFFVTWHGSDIHTIPQKDSVAKGRTIAAMEHASCNFFISQALMDISDALTTKGRKMVLYNGIDDIFKRLTKEVIQRVKKQYGASGRKIVTFAGNLKPVKNAGALPEIFARVKKAYDGELMFWIVGDGELKREMEEELNSLSVEYYMFGKLPYEKMPEIFSCTDVLVLPSLNEGMGLVTIEAMSCGADVVASAVGGIIEAVGEENCVPLTEHFVDDFAFLVVRKLECSGHPSVGSRFNWQRTSELERQVYSEILS